MSTFVSVGNATQSFRRMLDAVCENAKKFPQPVFIQYGAANDFTCSNCDVVNFIGMGEFDRRVAGAELLILHAGAGSVINAVRSGKLPVIIPRRSDLDEHVDNHQVEFCEQLKRTGKVIVVDDITMLSEACEVAITRQQAEDKSSFTEPQLVFLLREILKQEDK